MVMSEGAVSPEQMENGHQGDAPTRVGLSGADEVHRPRTGLSGQARDAEDVLSRARSHAESLGAQALAEAEELLSRAHSQAELLRVHADAMRAEADCLRAEAAAVLGAVRHDADASRSFTESVAAHASAAAEEFRSAVQLEVDAARQEFERMRTEALFIRRVLRAELDAGLADVDRMRGEVQRLCAETNKLAAELGLLFAAGGSEQIAVAGDPGGRPPDARPSNGPAPGAEAHAASDDPWTSDRPAGGDDSQTSASPFSPDEGAASGRRLDAAGTPSDSNVAELLRQIWDAASTGLGRLSDDGSIGTPGWATADDPAGSSDSEGFETGEREPGEAGAQARVAASLGEHEVGTVDGRRGWEPLIGSGGWRATEAAAPAAPEAGEFAASPPPPGRRRRRFHRG